MRLLRFQDRAYTIDEITKVAFKASFIGALGRKPLFNTLARRTSEVLQIFAALREPLVRRVEKKPAAYTYCGPGKVKKPSKAVAKFSSGLQERSAMRPLILSQNTYYVYVQKTMRATQFSGLPVLIRIVNRFSTEYQNSHLSEASYWRYCP